MKIALILFATLFCYATLASSMELQDDQVKNDDQLDFNDDDQVSNLADIEEIERNNDHNVKVYRISCTRFSHMQYILYTWC